jgi:hypothetical protein
MMTLQEARDAVDEAAFNYRNCGQLPPEYVQSVWDELQAALRQLERAAVCHALEQEREAIEGAAS